MLCSGWVPLPKVDTWDQGSIASPISSPPPLPPRFSRKMTEWPTGPESGHLIKHKGHHMKRPVQLCMWAPGSSLIMTWMLSGTLFNVLHGQGCSRILDQRRLPQHFPAPCTGFPSSQLVIWDPSTSGRQHLVVIMGQSLTYEVLIPATPWPTAYPIRLVLHCSMLHLGWNRQCPRMLSNLLCCLMCYNF